MYKLLIVMTLSFFVAAPAMAGGTTGCRNGHFLGSYISSPNPPTDLFGDGSVIHTFVYELTLNSDGTATQYWTGLPDYISTLGTASPWIGSWKCRSDGKLVVSMLLAGFVPVGPGVNNPTNDISLAYHSRWTYLFSVDDDETLTRTQLRTRTYGPADDPSVLTGGVLSGLNTSTAQYKRVVASDADLTP